MAVRVAMFREPESYIKWMENEIEAIRNHGLRYAEQALADAISGKSREGWFRMNNWCKPEDQDSVWSEQIEWLEGQVRSVRRKIKKYEREIKKVKAEYGIL